nr:MAG TPA: Protein of unknown function (DUF551) [Caudoviricetes sp.]
MTREEQIRQAALAYSFDTDGGHSGDLNAGRDDFIEGAKWADEHQANFWHKNIDGDLPKKSGRYLVMAQNGFCHTCKYKADSRYWDTVGYQSDIKYWMEIPELPK